MEEYGWQAGDDSWSEGGFRDEVLKWCGDMEQEVKEKMVEGLESSDDLSYCG